MLTLLHSLCTSSFLQLECEHYLYSDYLNDTLCYFSQHPEKILIMTSYVFPIKGIVISNFILYL